MLLEVWCRCLLFSSWPAQQNLLNSLPQAPFSCTALVLSPFLQKKAAGPSQQLAHSIILIHGACPSLVSMAGAAGPSRQLACSRGRRRRSCGLGACRGCGSREQASEPAAAVVQQRIRWRSGHGKRHGARARAVSAQGLHRTGLHDSCHGCIDKWRLLCLHGTLGLC